MERELNWAQWKTRLLEESLRLERVKKYGASSEKLSDAQMNLLDLEPGVSDIEVVAESAREALPVAKAKPERRPHPGRQELPAHLPRVERARFLRAGTVRVQAVRQPDGSDRLRHERAVGRRTGSVVFVVLRRNSGGPAF